MGNSTGKLLFDVLDSGQSIQQWCVGRTFADYESDRLFRRAVEREFEIIGEALNPLRLADPETAARITDLARIVGFRNRIIHGYDSIDDAAVWGILASYLPQLLLEVADLLGDPDPASDEERA